MTLRKRLLVIDAHAHLYPTVETGQFLDAAHRNFARLVNRSYDGRPFTGVIVLTDGERDDGFRRARRFCRSADPEAAGREVWDCEPTGEAVSLIVRDGRGARIVIIGGRQVLTECGLEVLALGTRHEFPSGEPAGSLIRRISEVGAVPVLPWGFGKWLGRRRDVIRELIRDETLPRFFLGDSGNRPRWWSESPIFQEAERNGIANLPGSDPLPLTGDYERVGEVSGIIEGDLGRTTPMRELKELLWCPNTYIETRRIGGSPLRVLRRQLAMQLEALW